MTFVKTFIKIFAFSDTPDLGRYQLRSTARSFLTLGMTCLILYACAYIPAIGINARAFAAAGITWFMFARRASGFTWKTRLSNIYAVSAGMFAGLLLKILTASLPDTKFILTLLLVFACFAIGRMGKVFLVAGICTFISFVFSAELMNESSGFIQTSIAFAAATVAELLGLCIFINSGIKQFIESQTLLFLKSSATFTSIIASAMKEHEFSPPETISGISVIRLRLQELMKESPLGLAGTLSSIDIEEYRIESALHEILNAASTLFLRTHTAQKDLSNSHTALLHSLAAILKNPLEPELNSAKFDSIKKELIDELISPSNTDESAPFASALAFIQPLDSVKSAALKLSILLKELRNGY